MLVGLDACQDEARVFHAYNDREGTTHNFILNGLTHINKLMVRRVFNVADWKVVGGYNSIKHCHQAFYQARSDVVVEGTTIKAGEQIRVEESYKYSPSQRDGLWKSAGLVSKYILGNGNDDYRESQTFPYSSSNPTGLFVCFGLTKGLDGRVCANIVTRSILAPLHHPPACNRLFQILNFPFSLPCLGRCANRIFEMPADIHVLSAPSLSFPLKPREYACKPVPTLDEFEHLWKIWDIVTKHMLPSEELLSKPINLRNCCLFYLGHIPTFLDIHMSR